MVHATGCSGLYTKHNQPMFALQKILKSHRLARERKKHFKLWDQYSDLSVLSTNNDEKELARSLARFHSRTHTELSRQERDFDDTITGTDVPLAVLQFVLLVATATFIVAETLALIVAQWKS